MRIGVYRGLRNIALEEWADPEAGDEGAVLAVDACGICGSDLHAYTHGAWIADGLPMGHEFAGTVQAVGPDVAGLEVGERVAVNPLIACGQCEACGRGTPNLCSNLSGAGGAFADKVLVSRAVVDETVFKVPDELSSEEAAWLEPFAVSVRAVNLIDPDPAEPVVVIGLGAIGQGVVQALGARGAQDVTVVDVSDMRIDAALESGAHVGVNAAEVDMLETIWEQKGTTSSPYQPKSGKIAAVFECSGHESSLKNALEMVRPGGDVLVVALVGHDITVDIDKVVQKEIKIKGSFAYALEDTREAFRMLASGEANMKPLISQQFQLGELEKAFADQLEKGSSIKVMIKPKEG
jgi:threonine dehydrogenase-like Zn-dependent dehydrogenase